MIHRVLLATVVAGVLAVAGCGRSTPPGRADASPSAATGTTTATTTPGATSTAPRPPGNGATSQPPRNAPTQPPLSTAVAAAGQHAEDLRSQTRCGPPGTRAAIADLAWRPAATQGTQRVVFTPYADGYRTGRYEVTADLAPSATSVSLQQLSPGSAYTWLVLTRHGDNWAPSATAQFSAPICVADEGGG